MMPDRDILIVLDQGTSATRAVAFDPAGRIVSHHTRAVHTRRPRPGHAEMDPGAILDSVDRVLHKALTDARESHWRPAALGLCVQRSSFLLWDEGRRQPLTPILTWQDTRAAVHLPRFRDHADRIAATTGMTLGPYYGGPKFFHLRHHPDTRSVGSGADTFFIPVETLIVRHLTGNLFIDETIAGRTLVYDLHRRRWSDELLELFELPRRLLPGLVSSHSSYGSVDREGFHIPFLVAMGDQQAAMTGLGAHRSGALAINYGTSGSVALHTGTSPRPLPGLLANVAFSTGTQVEYLLEGTVNAVGALFAWFAEQWNQPDLPAHWPERVADSTDLVLVPGVNGLAAPWWRPDVPTTFVPPVSDQSRSQQLRAGMESVAFLVTDIVERMFPGGNSPGLGDVHCGGGNARDPLLRFQADLLQHPLHLHRIREASARGAALRLAETLGWPDFGADVHGTEQLYEPEIAGSQKDEHRQRWRAALEQVLGD